MDKIWEAIFGIGLTVFAGGVLTVAGMAIFAPHTVQQYYVGRAAQTSSGFGPGFCVLKSINWDSDNAVYCSDDIDKVIAKTKELNATLPGGVK